MEKIKRLFISSICLLALLPLTSCEKKIVVNNAFVYLVHESCFDYGTIQGEQWQSVYVNESTTLVIATPKDGYKFVKWNDGLKEPSRTDKWSSSNNSGPVLYYAYFEVNNE